MSATGDRAMTNSIDRVTSRPADNVDVILRDGGTLRLRPPTRLDADELAAFFGRLSQRSLYLRFHGASGKYRGRYGRAALARLARDLRSHRGDAFVYFNNDSHGHAIRDALELKGLLSEDSRSRPAEWSPPA